MDLIIDTNIILAAVLKDGTTRELLLYRTPTPLKLYAPPFIIREVVKYRKYLSKKTGRPESEIVESALNLLSAANIDLLKSSEIKLWIGAGLELSPDPGDAMYFAAALLKSCKIWSNDKMLNKQNVIGVINTKELLELL